MDALDDIVNAITDILLAFEEAQADMKTNLVVEAKNLDFLLSEINKMIDHNRKQSNEIKDDNVRNRWEQTNIEISNAASRLATLIRSMKGGLIERWAYSNLHDELKILQNLIYEIQITDYVNVSTMMELVKRNLDCVIRMKNCVPDAHRSQTGAMNGLVLISRDASKVGLDLQIHLRTRMAEMTDAELRGRLNNATEAIRTGAPMAITACTRAIESSNTGTIAERDRTLYNIVEALGEISTVVQLSSQAVAQFALMFPLPPLTAKQNESYIRAPRVNQELNRLEDAVRRGDDKTAIAATKAFADEAQKQITQGRAAAELKKDPTAKAELVQYCNELQQLTPQVVSAAKEALANKNNKTAQNNLFDKIEQARQVNAKIEDAKKPERAIINLNKQLDKAYKQLAEYAKAGDAARAAEEARKIADQMKKQTALGRAFAENVKDAARKKEILDACDQLDKLIAEIARATKAVLENPNDLAAQKRLDELLNQARAQGARLAAAILEEQLALNKEALEANLANLYTAAKKGDEKAVAELMKDITDQIQRRIELGRELAQQVKDPELRRQIIKACDDLEKLLPELVLAAKAVLADPNDQVAQKRLKDIIEDIKKASDRVTAAKKFAQGNRYSLTGIKKSSDVRSGNASADSTAEEVIVVGGNLEAEMAKLKDALRRGDAKAASDAAAEITKNMKRQAELGRKLAEQCTDPVLKKKILDAADKLDSLCAPIVQATKDAIMNPNDKTKQQKVDQLLAQAKAANKVIVDAADLLRSNKTKLDDITSKMNNVGFLDTHSEFKADGTKDEIMVAAHQVSAATKAAKVPVIPEQKTLIDIAATIAKEMEQLSLAAQHKSKKDMIASARKIADMIQKIQSLSNEIAVKCTDPILKQQLLSICKVPKNFSVQLKIISAVKDTSNDDDPTAEAQLVTCAQGLANSVIQTVKAAEAASLKCPKH